MSRSIRRVVPFVGALAAFGAVAACSDASPTAVGSTGRLAVYLTDAPGDVRKAVVTIDRVYLQGDGGRTVLREEDLTVDLLTLADSVATLVPESGVPAGTYTERRFVVSGGYLEVEGEDGASAFYASSPDYAGLPAGTALAGALQMPSFAQSGLKVQFADSLVVGGDVQHLLVDFDVRESFGRQAGNSGRWVMSPVLKGSHLDAPPAATPATPVDSAATP